MATKLVHKDGWNNLFTGAGTNRDRNTSTRFGFNRFLDRGTLDALYTQNGLARRIINILPDDMLRAGWAISEDADGIATKYLNGNRLQFAKHLKKLLRWDRLYGGALMVIGAVDGGKIDQPLNEKRIKSIDFFRVYDRHQIYWTADDYVTDPMDPEFGKIQWYEVQPSNGAQPYRVHASRCIVLDGEEIPELLRARNQKWGLATLEYLMDELKNRGNMGRAIVSIVEDFVTTTLSMKNLQQLIATGQEHVVKKRLDILDMSKHVLNTVLLDENEQFAKSSSTVTGLSELSTDQAHEICAITGIPFTRLFGRSPGGMHATGDSDIRQWYDIVSAEQEEKLTPILSRIYALVFAAADCKAVLSEDDWSVKYNPLWQPTAKEKAETHKAQSEADKNYIEAQVLNPDEVAMSRFGKEEYSLETELKADRDPVNWEPPELPEPAIPATEPKSTETSGIRE